MYDEETLASTRSRSGRIGLVILGGLITTGLALLVTWALNWYADTNLMGWYFWFIVPAGAVLVGLVAGSGYSLASWMLGVKVTGIVLWSVLALQVAAYFEAQYLEYRHVMWIMEKAGEKQEIGFIAFFDFTTQSFAFNDKQGQPGPPLGGLGYGIRLLEVLGFALGGLIAPAILGSKDYCENCQVYMRSKSQTLLPAGIKPRKVKKNDTKGQQQYEHDLVEALNHGQALLEEAFGAAERGDADAFRRLCTSHAADRKAHDKLTSRVDLSLVSCPACRAGFLRATLHSGHGENVEQQELAR